MTDLQNKILEIFTVVEEICRKHNLRYYAVGGTCLGAVRHKGFIPWDDDLDIAMPDQDFRRFVEIARRELSHPYELISIAQLPHSTCLHAKVQNVETTFIEEGEIEYPDSYKGVFIDIFPLFGSPNDAKRRILFDAKLLFLKQLNEKQDRKRKLSDFKRIKGRILWLLVNGFLPVHFFPLHFWAEKWLSSIFKYSADTSTYVRDCGYRCYKRSEWYREGVRMPFENTTIVCPKNWERVMETQYGDYMKLPPENERITVHSGGGGIVDLERSYKYYASKRDRKGRPTDVLRIRKG